MKTKCSVIAFSLLACVALLPSCAPTGAHQGIPPGFRKVVFDGNVYYRNGDNWYRRFGNRYTSCPKPY